MALQLLKHSDRADDGLADGPCRLDAFGVLFALERSAVYSPAVGVADLVALGLDAAALDVFDYWCRAVIPTLHYSPESCAGMSGCCAHAC